MVDLLQTELVQNLGSSLVREYLFRTGLKCTLKCMDDEFPRSAESFNNRMLLARELKIEHYLREYKQNNIPAKSVLEIMLCIFLKERQAIEPENLKKRNCHDSLNKWTEVCQAVRRSSRPSVQRSQVVNIDRILWFYRQLSDRGVKINFQTLVHIYCDSFGSETQDSKISQEVLGRFRNGDRDENGDYKDPREEYNETLQLAMEYNRSHPKKYPPILSKNALKDKESILLDSIKAFKSHTSYDNRTRLGPNKENTFQSLKRSRSTSAMEQATTLPSSASHLTLSEPTHDSPLKYKSNSISLPHSQSGELKIPVATTSNTNTDQLPDSSNPIRNEDCDHKFVQSLQRKKSCDIDSKEIENSDDDRLHDPIKNEESHDFVTTTAPLQIRSDISSANLHNTNCNMVNLDNSKNSPKKEIKSTLTEDQERLLLSLKQRIDTKTNSIDEGSEDWYESEGLEEVEFITLRLSSAIALKKLVLGSAIRSFNLHWMGQSFVWNSNSKLCYGFSQNKGGACGVLASVQGFLLKSLLFHPDTVTSESHPLRPTKQEVQRALVQALTEILWRAGGCKQAAIVRSNQESHLEESLVYRPDGLTEVLSWKKFLTENDLQEAVEKHLDEFISPHGKGCLRFVISVILSRGIQGVIGDMDDETSPLIGPSGTCSVELVNLLLTGQAVSNVFDNDLQLDSCLLRGVSKRSDIGFLSIFEHFNSCQVGSNLKTPRYPIWLVNSDNHYSVVFSPCKQLVSDWRAERQFHLYHYDGLAGQTEERVLSVDTTGFSSKEDSKRDEVPPLELCIKTKWKDAIVHWSSSFS